MDGQDLKSQFDELYEYMATSSNIEHMKAFGETMREMMEWMIDSKPSAAQEWIEKLEAIRWHNYLTHTEAEHIVAKMTPKAPWSREQWSNAMAQQGYDLECQPAYNRCALWVTMNMIMSDSLETLAKYVNGDKIFSLVHDLAVDKLLDEDERFNIRKYFDV